MKSQEELLEDNEPRVYVASLSDYNNGDLLGRWFAFSDYDDADELLGAIGDMLKTYDRLYPLPYGAVREEWAAHDWEHVPSSLTGESPDLSLCYAYLDITAPMSDERKQAFDLYIEAGHDPDGFDDDYLGVFGDRPYDDAYTMECYAEESFWDNYAEADVPKALRNYIDFAAMGRDLQLGGDCWCNQGHVFRNC